MSKTFFYRRDKKLFEIYIRKYMRLYLWRAVETNWWVLTLLLSMAIRYWHIDLILLKISILKILALTSFCKSILHIYLVGILKFDFKSILKDRPPNFILFPHSDFDVSREKSNDSYFFVLIENIETSFHYFTARKHSYPSNLLVIQRGTIKYRIFSFRLTW